MKQTDLVIFDFDGTLADSMWAWDELGSDTLKERGIEVFDDYADVIRTMSVPKFAEYLTERYPILGSADALLASWHKKMEFNYCNRIVLKAGAKEFLERLSLCGYEIYLASATHAFLLEKALRHFDIEKYFGHILTEDVIGTTKREPLIYKTCMGRAGAQAAKTFVFEDAVHAIKTAKGLGIETYAVADASMKNFREEIYRCADAVIEDFRDARLESFFE